MIGQPFQSELKPITPSPGKVVSSRSSPRLFEVVVVSEN